MSANLTLREHEVLRLVADVQSNKEIARALGIARSTVDLHVHHILRTLGVVNRVAAVLWALQRGIGDRPPQDTD